MPLPRSGRVHRPRRLSIAGYLSLGIGGLMIIAVGSVLVVLLYANWRNTTELLEDKSRMLLGSLITHTERWLEPAAALSDALAQMMRSGELDPADDARLLDTLRAVLAATPQIHAVAVFRPDGSQATAARHDEQIVLGVRDWRKDRAADEAVAEAKLRMRGRPYWGPPVYVEGMGTVLNVRRPVWHEDRWLGLIVSVFRIEDLSAFLAELETEFGQNAFILYDRDYVLAHRAFETGGFTGLDEERPLPRVTEIGDPVLFNIWREGWQERRLIAGSGHQDRLGQDDYIYLYAPLTEYGDAPWMVGSYFAEEHIARQFLRMIQSAVGGIVALILAVALAYLLGRALRQPIEDLAGAASAVRELHLDAVPGLPRSRFRELDDAGRAFNAMVAALRAFATYVPRDVVSRLIARGDPGAIGSETREVTVMFTDIVGFTARTEPLRADQTAAFLNRHFALLTACIEAEGGTVDKYMGDGLMALWGAIDPQPDHAARAIRAAAAIARALRADNAGRDRPVRLRVGLHSGPVVVGNIGTPSRMNYTVVGDTVNLAQRLQELARDLIPDAEVAVLISAAAAAQAPIGLQVQEVGRHQLRGRSEPTEVFRLEA